MTNLHAVIMAGGSGTRFWPASRAKRPKHFLQLAHDDTLIRATVDRVAPVVGIERTWIVTNPVLAAEMPTVLPDFPAAQVIVEPEPRDTAPCVALASAVVEARDPGATMAFMPCDHLISPQDKFEELLRRAADVAAASDSIVTFGIRPTSPATVYGYIERGPALDDTLPPAHRVLRFREKPDRATATQFVDSGTFLWNSGMFVWRLGALLEAMDAGDPKLAQCTRSLLEAARVGSEEGLATAFAETPKTSVDYAVMEKAPSVLVLEADLSWNDLGSFLTLDAVHDPDSDGNVIALHNQSRTVLEQSKNCTVYGDGPQAIALMGVEDLIVVSTGDALLVCAKDKADELKALVKRLPAEGMGDLL